MCNYCCSHNGCNLNLCGKLYNSDIHFSGRSITVYFSRGGFHLFRVLLNADISSLENSLKSAPNDPWLGLDVILINMRSFVVVVVVVVFFFLTILKYFHHISRPNTEKIDKLLPPLS